jgi:hypothetical protein
VKTIRLDIELYLRGGLGASLEEKGWPAVGASDEGGCGGSPVCRREGEERKREEREMRKKGSHGLNFPPVVPTSLA